MFRLALLWALLLLFRAPLTGQNASNPFELRHRLPQEALAVAGETVSVNPFDVKAHRIPGASRALAENTTKPFRPSRLLPERSNNLPAQALFWMLLGMFALLTFCVAANRKVVGRAWRAFLNDNGLAVAQREAAGFIGVTPYFLLYGSFLLNAGMFIFLVARVFRKEAFNNWAFMMVCFLAASVIFLSKHVILSLTGWLFTVEKEARRYNFLIIIFNCVLGLFLLPFNFLLAFSEKYNEFWVFWTLGLIAIFYFYRALRSGRSGTKFLTDNQFHFLLYLCAAEVAPVLLLVKLAMIQAS